MVRIFILAASLLLLAGCQEPHKATAQEEALVTLAANEYLEGAVWLEQLSVLGQWDKVVLIFGWYDDQTNCELIRDHFNEVIIVPVKREYRCTPVETR